MSSPWFHYHTAFELLAGANLALFALPNLREPAIAGEARRWASLQAIAGPGHCRHTDVLAGVSAFRRATRDIERQIEGVRMFCLANAALCTGTLLWATARAEETPDPLGPWIILSMALAPAIILFGLDGNARSRLRQSAAMRRRLENEVVQQ
jgi:hypothetical protein